MYLCGMKLPVNTTYEARATAPAGSAFTPPRFNSLIINNFHSFTRMKILSIRARVVHSAQSGRAVS